jgi:hypothetical protein
MGLLCLLPAIAGSMIAFFVFSLLHKSISIAAWLDQKGHEVHLSMTV